MAAEPLISHHAATACGATGSTGAAPACPRITFQAGESWLDVAPKTRYVLQPSSIARSRLLSGIREQLQDGSSSTVHVPVAPVALLAWLSRVQPGSQPLEEICEAHGSGTQQLQARPPLAITNSCQQHPHVDMQQGLGVDFKRPPPAAPLPPDGDAAEEAEEESAAQVQMLPMRVVAPVHAPEVSPCQPASSGAWVPAGGSEAACAPQERRPGAAATRRVQPPRGAKKHALPARSRTDEDVTTQKARKVVAAGHMHGDALFTQLERTTVVGRAVGLLKVADVLVDETTEAEACAELATLLQSECRTVTCRRQPRPRASQPRKAQKVLSQLSEDTALRVLRAMHVPLPQLLHYLAATPFCSLALRALHPSIDTHATLRLPQWPPLSTKVALSACTTLTHLHTLSLAGLSLARLHSDSGPHPLAAALSALPCLSSLSLRNTVLAPAAAALAAALPQLPHLKSLDLSHNCLDAFFAPLAAALPTLPMLHTLRLAGTLSTYASLRLLADSVRNLSALTRLSIGSLIPTQGGCSAWGSHGTEPLQPSMQEPEDSGDEPRPVQGLLHLAAALPRVSSLRSLEFGFVVKEYTRTAPTELMRIGAALGSLRQLRHLGVHCRAFFNLDKLTEAIRLQPMPLADVQTPVRWWGKGFAALTGLTSLDCRLNGSNGPLLFLPMRRFLEHLAPLKCLRSVHLPRSETLRRDECAGFWRALSQLTGLTHVQVGHCSHGLSTHVHELIRSLAALPQLQSVTSPWQYHADSGYGELSPDAACSATMAVAAAAAAGKTVKLSLIVENDVRSLTDVVSRDGRAAILPLCPCLYMRLESQDRTTVIEGALRQMTAMTSLGLRLGGISQSAEDSDEDADAYAEQGAAGGGPWEPVRGASWRSLLQTCGQLSQLRELRVTVTSAPAFRYLRDQLQCMHAKAASVARRVAAAVRSLQHLTSLVFGCGTMMWGPCLPRLTAACEGLSALRSLAIVLDDDERQAVNDLKEFGEAYDGQISAMQANRVDRPVFSTFGALTQLQRLAIQCHGAHSVEELIAYSLPRLTRLQSLALFVDIDSGVVDALARCVRTHLKDLRHLGVGDWQSEDKQYEDGQYENGQSEDVQSDGQQSEDGQSEDEQSEGQQCEDEQCEDKRFLRLKAGVGSCVLVHLESGWQVSGGSDSEEDEV